MSSHLRNEIDVDKETKHIQCIFSTDLCKNKEKNENPISLRLMAKNRMRFSFLETLEGSKCEIDSEILLSFKIGFVLTDAGGI